MVSTTREWLKEQVMISTPVDNAFVYEISEVIVTLFSASLSQHSLDANFGYMEIPNVRTIWNTCKIW